MRSEPSSLHSTLHAREEGRGATLRTQAAYRLKRTLGSLLCLGLVACSACERERVAHYRCRGVVRAIEGRGDEARVAIEHEALPSFEDRDGKTSPMGSMTMIFGLAPQLSREQLSLNEKLSFEFDVTWHESPFLVITRVTALPATTSLQLSPRRAHP